MYRNTEVNNNSCWKSCWNHEGTERPNRCIHLDKLANELKKCWKKFCRKCQKIFVNANTIQQTTTGEGSNVGIELVNQETEWETQPSHHYHEGTEWETQPSHHYHEGTEWETQPSHHYHEGTEWETQPSHHYHEGTEWETAPSSSQNQYYNTWDEEVSNLSAQFTAIKLKGRFDINDYELLLMFNRRILQNAKNICYHLNPYGNPETPLTNNFCEKIKTLESYVYQCIIVKESGNLRYYEIFNRIIKYIRNEYYHNDKIYPFECVNFVASGSGVSAIADSGLRIA
uniref:PRESAN domain-containing protein n=1 Tax=Meloidogyne hapla TaxID=6305 RepID=A0A1I8B8J6_MELHA